VKGIPLVEKDKRRLDGGEGGEGGGGKDVHV